MKGTRTRRAMFATALGLAMAGTAAGLAAQTNEQFDKTFPFLGGWDAQVGSPNGQDRGNCGGHDGRLRRETGELFDASGSTSPELTSGSLAAIQGSAPVAYPGRLRSDWISSHIRGRSSSSPPIRVGSSWSIRAIRGTLRAPSG